MNECCDCEEQERDLNFPKLLPITPTHMHTCTYIHLLIGLLGANCNDEVFVNEGVEKSLTELGGDLGVRGQRECWTLGSRELGREGHVMNKQKLGRVM